MAIFEYQYTSKYCRAIDDTHEIRCLIETTQENNGHTEYLLRLERGPYRTNNWKIIRRYRDFSALNKCLRVSGIELPLPGKRLIGNMRTEFIAERRRALQIFIDTVFMNPILASSLPARRFVDPDTYAQPFHDNAVQNASLILRNESLWALSVSLGAIGWRLRKHYFHVTAKPNEKAHCNKLLQKSGSQQSKHAATSVAAAANNSEQTFFAPSPTNNAELVLEYLEYGPDKYIDDKELSGIMRSLMDLQHPNIEPIIYSNHNENGCLVIRNLYKNGTLKDMLCNSTPKNSFLSKYGNPKKRVSLTYKQVANYGRQILDALIFLHSKGFPYGHLHSGNIVIVDDCVKLLDIENYILGVPAFYRPFFVQHSKIHSIESIEVYCLGHVLFEMTMGHPLQESVVRQIFDCPEALTNLLESILSKEACRAGLPTLQQLRDHEFFAQNTAQAAVSEANTRLKLSVNATEAIRQAVLKTEHRLRDEQKLVKNQKRIVRVQEMMSSEETKKKQKAKTEQKIKLKQQSSLQKGNGSIEAVTSSIATMNRADSMMTSGPSVSTRPPLSPTNRSASSQQEQQGQQEYSSHERITKQNTLASVDRQSSSTYTSSEEQSESTRSSLLESICRFNRGSLRKVRSNDLI